MNLGGIDLNLLTAFDALLMERNVTKAASRVGVSQPAMSSALARLRLLFNDPLFIRTQHGMAPTVKALELSDRIQHALAEIRGALKPEEAFDPASSVREFRLATTDYGDVIILPQLVQRLKSLAPGITLRASRLRRSDTRLALQSGELDLAIAWRLEEPPFDHRAFCTRSLFRERLVCIVRKDHPHVGDRLTMKQFLQLEHVVVSASDGSPMIVDSILAQEGLSRRVSVTVAHFLAAPIIVAQTDLMATVASRVTHLFSDNVHLRILKAPISLPALTVRTIWHERSNNDPAHRWFRKLLADVASESRSS